MGVASQINKLDYLWWAAAQASRADTACPGCGSETTTLVRRKYVVTSLYECKVCKLRFRVPKESQKKADKLYRKEAYRQSFTTAVPNPTELAHMLDTNFRETEKDYSPYIEILRSTGLRHGARILDFGCSWGYGSWQMARAGFSVASLEIGEERARYAREQLGCEMVADLRALDGTIEAFFSAHVIEHLPDPKILFREAARLLVPGGFFVCFCPNGNPARQETERYYHQSWGKVHPLLITPGFMEWACREHDFQIQEMRAGKDMLGPELLVVARTS